MYLTPSKYWWVYLGVRSNPAIASRMDSHFDRAIFFDDPALIPPLQKSPSQCNAQYFYILWDGVAVETLIVNVKLLLGPDANLTTLIVGDYSHLPPGKYEVENLYADGVLNFTKPPIPFDLRTATILLATKIKTILMPLKNLSQGKRSAWQGIKLLVGKKKVVFCGAYGIVPRVLWELCDRHSIDFSLFNGYEFYCNDPARLPESYEKYLRKSELFLYELYERAEVNAAFFLAIVHLLGREYFLEKIRAAGIDLFVNGYDTDININVYTTPFYFQHVFVDFGSVIGTGNYPRLVDLKYFNKNVIEISANNTLEETVALARNGLLAEHFDKEWELKAPKLLKAMERSRSNQG